MGEGFSIHHPTNLRYATPAIGVAVAYPGRVGGIKDRGRISRILESATCARVRFQIIQAATARHWKALNRTCLQ
ncbi:protein of unknown function [Pseudomonas sp. JV241A]|nr:protein of unknown function [Pseudomonas sp. JV241A]